MLLAKDNIELNKCKDNISIHEYYWGSDINQTTMKHNNFDIVIGADCIYLKDTYKSLIQSFIDIFKYNQNAIIILAFAERFYHQNIFYNLLKKNKSFIVEYIQNLDIDLAKTKSSSPLLLLLLLSSCFSDALGCRARLDRLALCFGRRRSVGPPLPRNILLCVFIKSEDTGKRGAKQLRELE